MRKISWINKLTCSAIIFNVLIMTFPSFGIDQSSYGTIAPKIKKDNTLLKNDSLSDRLIVNTLESSSLEHSHENLLESNLIGRTSIEASNLKFQSEEGFHLFSLIGTAFGVGGYFILVNGGVNPFMALVPGIFYVVVLEGAGRMPDSMITYFQYNYCNVGWIDSSNTSNIKGERHSN